MEPHNRTLEKPQADDRGMLVIAEENQSCSAWAITIGSSVDDNPTVYQTDFDGDEHGPWINTGQRYRAFIDEFANWNRANGGSPVSIVGGATERTASELSAITASPSAVNVSLYRIGSLSISSSPDGDIYIYGGERPEVLDVAERLALAWYDIEESYRVPRWWEFWKQQ